MIKISITEYKTNELGEIDKTEPAKVSFERLDLNNFYELFKFEKLLNPKKVINVKYENGERVISVVGKDFRRYIRII